MPPLRAAWTSRSSPPPMTAPPCWSCSDAWSRPARRSRRPRGGAGGDLEDAGYPRGKSSITRSAMKNYAANASQPMDGESAVEHCKQDKYAKAVTSGSTGSCCSSKGSRIVVTGDRVLVNRYSEKGPVKGLPPRTWTEVFIKDLEGCELTGTTAFSAGSAIPFSNGWSLSKATTAKKTGLWSRECALRVSAYVR